MHNELDAFLYNIILTIIFTCNVLTLLTTLTLLTYTVSNADNISSTFLYQYLNKIASVKKKRDKTSETNKRNLNSSKNENNNA